MAIASGVSRYLLASVAAAGLCLVSYNFTQADDNGPAPRPHHKTLQERILEVQAGLHDVDIKGPKQTTFVGPDLSDHERAVEVLNRMSFGPRPGEVDDVVNNGYQTWMKQQLDPDKIDDSECDKLVESRFPWLKMTLAQMDDAYSYEKGDKATRNRSDYVRRMLPQLVLTRQVNSNRQFKEVMCEFWRNHFCVDQPAAGDQKSRTWTAADYEEQVIRKYAFGDFKNMLFASARHPAMLEYLDNQLSKANNWNENYAREVMELHTVGADKGYGDRDVKELSKVLTGWQYDDSYHFHFNASEHQPGPKQWMGMSIPQGYEGGETALYTLAMARATGDFISEKLCKFLVNDNPSPQLVKKVSSVFRESKGNLPKVYWAILSSPDFMSRENYRAKFKSPIHFVVTSLRATGSKIENLEETTQRLSKMGEPVYQCPDPTGYRDVAESWMDAGVLTSRWQFAWDLMRNEVSGVKPGDEFFGRYKGLKGQEAEAKMIEDLIGGDVGDHELTALKEPAAQGDLPRMASIILGSPSFQQR